MLSVGDDLVPLTAFQRIFLHEWLLDPTSRRYNMVLDQILSGPVDLDRLNDSVTRLVDDNHLLSSCVADERGRAPHWVRRRRPREPLLVHHPRELSPQELLALASAPFDLHAGPLARFHAIRMRDGRLRIIYILHHIVVDGSSFPAIAAAVTAYYNDPRHASAWSVEEQRHRHRQLSHRLDTISARHREEMHGFWRRRLRGVSGEPLDFLRPPASERRRSDRSEVGPVGELRFHFDAATRSDLQTLRRRHRVTPYVFGQVVFGALLHRLGGLRHLAVSFPAAIPEGAHLAFGAQVNNLLLDLAFDRDTTPGELVARTLAYYAELKESRARYLPIDEIVRFAGEGRMLEASFAQTVLKDTPLAYDGLDVEVRHELNVDLPHPLICEQELTPEQVNHRIRFDPSALDARLVARFAEQYATLFSEVLASLVDQAPIVPVSAHRLLEPAALDELVRGSNQTARPYPAEHTVHQLFEAQVRRTPDRTAVVYESARLTYAELDACANRLAAHLGSAHAVAPGDRVALCLERSEQLVVAILAVLKAGAAYVPLDPTHPDARLAFILDDSAARLVLTDGATHARCVGIAHGRGVAVEDLASLDGTSLDDVAAREPSVRGAPHDLFYVVYTSGTTGRPKGVAIEHRHVTPILDAIRDAYDFTHAARVTAFTSFGFDVSSSEIFVTLVNGGELHVLSERVRTDVDALADYLEAHAIEYAYLPPALLAVLPRRAYPALGTIVYAGEPCDRETGRYWSARVRLFNYYGPTETNIATGKRVEGGDVHLIGRPVANATAYVLDANGAPLPVGAVGELYLGGAAVARGYLNQPELTAERFVRNPFATSAGDRSERLYRTGDRARWLPGGDLEFLGRDDHQVKIDGHRIELQEIESRMTELAGVEQAVVVLRSGGDGRARSLAAFYVTSGALDEPALMDHLRAHLPAHMVPATLSRLDALPLTANGKVDRTALARRAPEIVRSLAPPEDDRQAQLRALFADALGCDAEAIGIDDDFFRLGGTSIIAIRLVSAIRSHLDVALSPAVLFASRTIRALSAALRTSAPAPAPVAATRSAVERDHPLSFAQERLWFIDAYEGKSDAYNIAAALRLAPGTSLESLLAAFGSVVARHAILRSRIITTAEGEGRQVVDDAPSDFARRVERVRVTSRAALDEVIDQASRRAFALDTEPPLRVTVVELDGDTPATVVSVVVHHIAFDGWSVGILVRELTALHHHHEASRLGAAARTVASLPAPVDVQYHDYATWQREHLTRDRLAEQVRHWTQHLAGFTPLDLPVDKPRPPRFSYAGADLDFALDEPTTARLRAVARELEVSVYAVLLAGYYLLLAAFSHQDDIVVGMPIANRHHPGVEGTIGFFANTLAVRQRVEADELVADFIRRVGRAIVEAERHQDLPFERLVAELAIPPDGSRHPIFQAMFALQELDPGVTREGNALFTPYETPRAARESAARFDLTASITDDRATLRGRFNYATSLFEEPTIRSCIATYVELLGQIAAMTAEDARRLRVADLRFVSEAARDALLAGWSQAAISELPETTIQALFAAQAARTPDAVALVAGERAMTYRELDAESDRLAWWLTSSFDVRPDDRIALCLRRSSRIVVAMLAVAKAGGAYVPIDPSAPEGRISRLLEESGAIGVITDEVFDAPLSDQPTSSLPPRGRPEDLCYVIFTSGTTGRPKGVMIEHRQLLNYVRHRQTQLGPGDRVASFSSYTFDAIASCLWPALLNGNTVVLLLDDERSDLSRMIGALEAHQVTHVSLPASIAGELCRCDLSRTALRSLVTGGEVYTGPFPPAPIRWINEYGPTEIGVCATMDERETDGDRRIIGRPIPNVTTYVLDDAGRLLPPGAIGELYIGGAGVARGYSSGIEATRERFVPNPFRTAEDVRRGVNARLYRTGDLVRYLPDRRLTFLGRNDAQIKLRGYRIEPGEIEATLRAHPGVLQAAVVARTDAGGQRYLAAYCVVDRVLDEAAVAKFLSTRLPDYMVPSAFVAVPELPRTAHGKLDRAALPEPARSGRTKYRAPGTETEQRVAHLFAEVLGLEPTAIGLDDDFFERGGNSLSAVKLLTRLNRELGRSLKLAELFVVRTAGGLAARLDVDDRRRVQTIVPLAGGGDGDALFMVHAASSGCEVYASLARRVGDELRCFGVDSYNLYQTKMYDDLRALAGYYLSCIDEVEPRAPRRLLGWSLGGQIALEIAALYEARGETDVHVFLVDTVLPDATIDALRIPETDEELAEVVALVGNVGVHGDEYRRFHEMEGRLAEQRISRRLRHTRVTLFKALGANAPLRRATTDALAAHVRSLPFNNADTVVESRAQLHVVELPNVHHWNVLTAEDAIAAELRRTLVRPAPGVTAR